MKTFKTIEEIKAERLAQREKPVIYSLLGVILGELDRRPNPNIPVTESDIYKVIKKLYDAAIECNNKEEEEYLEEFIKKQMSATELRQVIFKAYNSGEDNIGKIMKYLNVNYSGQFDGRLANNLIKEVIS